MFHVLWFSVAQIKKCFAVLQCFGVSTVFRRRVIGVSRSRDALFVNNVTPGRGGVVTERCFDS